MKNYCVFRGKAFGKLRHLGYTSGKHPHEALHRFTEDFIADKNHHPPKDLILVPINDYRVTVWTQKRKATRDKRFMKPCGTRYGYAHTLYARLPSTDYDMPCVNWRKAEGNVVTNKSKLF